MNYSEAMPRPRRTARQTLLVLPTGDAASSNKAEGQPTSKTAKACCDLSDGQMNRISKVVSHVILAVAAPATFFLITAYNDFPASNQNNHALHASVLSGFTPALSEDWLYKTADPFPLATWITALFLHFGPGGVYFLYFVVVAAFMLAFAIFIDSHKGRKAPAPYLWSGLTVLIALVLGRLTGLSAGVADQLILGSYWQPSEAGVILVISVLLFASHWPVSSAACAALAVALHPSIAFGALILVTAACARLMVERQWRELLILGGVFILLAMPAIAYTVIQFMPTTSDLAARASRILAREKIPFHAIPTEWVSTLDMIKILMIGIAGYMCRTLSRRLSFVIVFSLICGILLTLIFAVVNDDRLLLLFPWRVSAVLAPIALVLIISALLNSLPHEWIQSRYSWYTGMVFIGILAGLVTAMKIHHDYPGFMPAYWIEAGLRNGVYNMKIQDKRDRTDVINWAKNQDSKDMYLVPLNFEQFRIKSGRPIFVDWKSHPFKDVEVIEWRRRIEVANKAFENLRECKKINSSEFNVVIVDNSSVLYRAEPSCKLYDQKQINSRFGFVKLY